MTGAERLDRSFFARPTEHVAVDLLGRVLVSNVGGERVAGRIVETEAYLAAHDLASHAAMYQRGRDTLSQSPGTVYIYRCYGVHMMFNIVARAEAPHGAILVRAVDPLDGVESMRRRRDKIQLKDLSSGPGKVCQAFAFTLDDHLRDIACDPELWIEPGTPVRSVQVSPRIGITRSADLPLRFFDPDGVSVSGHRRGLDWTPEIARSLHNPQP